MDNSTSEEELTYCGWGTRSIFAAWFAVYLLFLPVFLFVLYIGFNKWKKPQSSASGSLSHSDVFTLNMATMEMVNILSSGVTCYGFVYGNNDAVSIGTGSLIATSMGQMLFHSITCVERYLAVVHPVTYLRLKGEGGVTIRNICITLIWLTSVGYSLLLGFIRCFLFHAVTRIILSVAPFPSVAFCSIYVLCVLSRPKPGERGGNRMQIDQSKRNTVYTMAAILGALLLRLIVGFAHNLYFFLPGFDLYRCVVAFFFFWSTLPSSLVLPLLFLQRMGKLTCCK